MFLQITFVLMFGCYKFNPKLPTVMHCLTSYPPVLSGHLFRQVLAKSDGRWQEAGVGRVQRGVAQQVAHKVDIRISAF